MIDPQDPEAFFGAKLPWEETGQAGHREMLSFYRELLALRRNHHDLTDGRLDRVTVEFDEDQRWIIVRRGALTVIANVGEDDQVVSAACSEILLASDEACTLTAGGVFLPAQSATVVVRLAGDCGGSPGQQEEERAVGHLNDATPLQWVACRRALHWSGPPARSSGRWGW